MELNILRVGYLTYIVFMKVLMEVTYSYGSVIPLKATNEGDIKFMRPTRPKFQKR